MKMLGLDSIRVDRSTLEMIFDQSGLDYAQQGSLPAREVRKLLEAVDPRTAAKAGARVNAAERFNKTDRDTATPAEMNRLLEMIFNGEIVDRAASDKIIYYLKE